MPMNYKLSMGFAACALLALLQPLQAQDTYPSKPVQIITPAAAGNSPDVAARVFADKLSQLWKQQIVIINRPGAGGLIAAQAASQAEKDGYTLYMTQASTYTVLPVMQEGKLPFDLNKDFVPIGLVGEQPIAVAVAPNLAVNSLPELLELIKTTRLAVRRHKPRRAVASHRRTPAQQDRAQSDLRARGGRRLDHQ
jgi:tripartite-type tricarboxylate transporter receptor subunit TctC